MRTLDHPHHLERDLPRGLAHEVATVAGALDAALGDPAAVTGGVHDARRATKRLRALVRLGRAALGPGVARGLGRRARAAARELTGLRDRAVRHDALGRREVGELDAATREDLRRRAEAAGPPPHTDREALLASRAAVEELADALDAVRLPDDLGGFRALEPGLRRIHSRGRRALDVARRRRDAPSFHRLRKRAKDVRHTLEWLEGAWPPVARAWSAELHRLTDLLGEANDLELLRALLPPDHPAHTPLASAQEARWREALPLAGRVWAFRGGAAASLPRTLGRWWRLWEADDPAPHRGPGPCTDRPGPPIMTPSRSRADRERNRSRPDAARRGRMERT